MTGSPTPGAADGQPGPAGGVLAAAGGPLLPEFLQAICARSGRRVNNIDLLCVAAPLPGPPPPALAPLALAPLAANPLGPAAPAPPAQTPLPLVTGTMARLARALRYRDDVRAWKVPGGILMLGRGVAGRWEVSLEVEPEYRGQGLGRELALAARHLVPGGAPLWAQIAPGNAASVRAFLAAGYQPAGAEALVPLA